MMPAYSEWVEVDEVSHARLLEGSRLLAELRFRGVRAALRVLAEAEKDAIVAAERLEAAVEGLHGACDAFEEAARIHARAKALIGGG